MKNLDKMLGFLEVKKLTIAKMSVHVLFLFGLIVFSSFGIFQNYLCLNLLCRIPFNKFLLTFSEISSKI